MYAQAVVQQVQELKADNFQKLHLLRLPASVMQVLLPDLLDIFTRPLQRVTTLLGPLDPAAPAHAWPGSRLCMRLVFMQKALQQAPAARMPLLVVLYAAARAWS